MRWAQSTSSPHRSISRSLIFARRHMASNCCQTLDSLKLVRSDAIALLYLDTPLSYLLCFSFGFVPFQWCAKCSVCACLDSNRRHSCTVTRTVNPLFLQPSTFSSCVRFSPKLCLKIWRPAYPRTTKRQQRCAMSQLYSWRGCVNDLYAALCFLWLQDERIV